MARRRVSLPRAVAIDIPPDPRPLGPLTSDDRDAWGGDVTRGGQVFCSEVTANAPGDYPLGVQTVNTRRLQYNPYKVGAHEPEAEEQ